MQNVVDVACSSPPVTMNATKPAAQTVQAADQDNFGLVLQKTSERIANEKQSDGVKKSNDSKSIDNIRGSESSASKKVSDTKNESEVNKTRRSEKSKKTDEPEKSETLTNAEHSNEETVVDPSTLVFGYVAPTITVVENTAKVEEVNIETTSAVAGEAIQPVNLVQVASTTAVQEDKTVSDSKVSLEQAAAASTSDSTTAGLETKVETETTISSAETLDKDARIGEKTTTDLIPAADDQNEKLADGGKVSVSTSTNTQGEQVIGIARKYQEVFSTTEAAIPVKEKPTEVGASPQTAPPDIPEGTTGVAASAAVQTTTQISEPARLAEAPKNEVITQVANQIDQMVKTNRSSVRLQLYPEELGHIDLRIVTTKDGISVTMLTEKASTQQVLKSDMDVLKQNIEQAGIQLTNLNINQGQNSNRQQAFEHRQNFSNNSYPGSSSDNSNSSSNEPKKHLTSSLVDYKV